MRVRSQLAVFDLVPLSTNRSLRSAGFQPAVSPTFSRPGVGLRERVQRAGPVGYARRLRVENPRYRRLESLRYRVPGPKACPIWDWRLSMNHGIGTPDSSGSFRHGSAPCRMNPAFPARASSWSRCAFPRSWRLPMNDRNRRQVLDCASPLALSRARRVPKRQWGCHSPKRCRVRVAYRHFVPRGVRSGGWNQPMNLHMN